MVAESKAERLAEQIQSVIDAEDLDAGTPLGTKAALQKKHTVAAGTLNEALRLLRARGYIDMMPGPRGGIFVADRSQRFQMRRTLLAAQEDPLTVDDCMQVQDALQGMMAARAAADRTGAAAAEIEAAVQQLRAARGARDVLVAAWDVDRAIARAGGNAVLTDMYCGILDTLQASVQRYSLGPTVSEKILQVHEDLARAVIDGDIDAAERAALLHSPIKPSAQAKKRKGQQAGGGDAFLLRLEDAISPR
ncbi:FadR/GntR family transcriptional regulator [Sinomonas sp. B1-1]|uniref:FadR/GntR family transcriptional regulator n=1 Tax=Sinomonas sp. B1-1 TaxID=3141454 RepID=UPI003D2D3687